MTLCVDTLEPLPSVKSCLGFIFSSLCVFCTLCDDIGVCVPVCVCVATSISPSPRPPPSFPSPDSCAIATTSPTDRRPIHNPSPARRLSHVRSKTSLLLLFRLLLLRLHRRAKSAPPVLGCFTTSSLPASCVRVLVDVSVLYGRMCSTPRSLPSSTAILVHVLLPLAFCFARRR